MKRTIFILCLSALLASTVGCGYNGKSPPTAEPTAPNEIKGLLAEKKQELPPVATVAPAPTPTPAQVETAAVAPVAAPVSEETTITQPIKKPQSTHIPTATTQTATKPSNPATVRPSAPKMGDKRTVDGETQIWIDGFGWIRNEGGGGCGTFVDGMGEMGNKVGIMGGESAPTKKSSTLYEPAPSEIVQELIPTPTKDSTPPDYKPDNPVPDNPRQSKLDPEHASFDKIIGY